MDQAHDFAAGGEPLRPEQRSSEMRLHEAHHRIANDLAVIASMVRLQAQAIAQGPALPAGRARELLNDTAARIDAVGRLHRSLCYADGHAAADFLRGLCKDAASFAGTHSATVLCRIDDMSAELSGERLRTLGLLMHEIVLNALKHAHPTGVPVRIDVWSREEPAGVLAVDIGDDGIGLPEVFDPARDGGFGFHMMHTLAKQMNATLAFDSSELGLVVRIRAPVRVGNNEA